MDPTKGIVIFLQQLALALGLPGTIDSVWNLVDKIKSRGKGADKSEVEALALQVSDIKNKYAGLVSAHESLQFWKEAHECFQDFFEALYENIFKQADKKEAYRIDVALLVDIWKDRTKGESKLLHKSLRDFRSKVVPVVAQAAIEDIQGAPGLGDIQAKRAVTAKNDFISNVQKTTKGFAKLEEEVEKDSPKDFELHEACKAITEGVRLGLTNADTVLYNLLLLLHLTFVHMKGSMEQ